MRFLTAALLALLLPAAAAQTEAPAEPPLKASAPLTLELKNAQWFDGQGWRRGSLYVADGQFIARKPAKVNRSLSLKGQYLIPPLAEAHNHNLQNAWGVDHYAQRYLRDGVYYAAMLCGDPAGVDPIRDRLAGPETPDVLFVTACITSSDGHPLAMLGEVPNQDHVLVMDTPADVERLWPQVAPRRTDWVKLVMSYHERPELRQDPAQRGRLGMEPATAAAIVRMAHRDGLKVVAHADSAADFEAAVDAGVDLIGHLPGYFNHHGDGPEHYLLSPAAVEKAARRGVAVITTTAATSQFKAPPEQLAALRRTQQRNLGLLKAAGVPLLLGSDVFMETARAELNNLASLEAFSPVELLRMATITTPQALFPKRRLGCFEPGCEASFLILATDPVEDLRALDQPLMRVKQGRLLTPFEDVAQASDKTSMSTEGPPRPAKAKGRKKPTGKAAPAKPAAKKAAKPATAKKR